MRLLALTAAALLLGGCGGSTRQTAPRQPHLPRALAAPWRAQADAVAAALAAGDGCTARTRAVALQASVIDAVRARRVSPRFQESLMSAVNELAARIGCTPAPAPAVAPHGPPKHETPHGHDHGHGHGKKH